MISISERLELRNKNFLSPPLNQHQLNFVELRKKKRNENLSKRRLSNHKEKK